MKQEAPRIVVEAGDDGEWRSWAAISSGGEIEEKGESGRGGCIPKAAEADMREENNTALGRGERWWPGKPPRRPGDRSDWDPGVESRWLTFRKGPFHATKDLDFRMAQGVLHMLNSVSKGGSNTKETPKSTDRIGWEQNFGSKEFTLGPSPRYKSMKRVLMWHHFLTKCWQSQLLKKILFVWETNIPAWIRSWVSK